MRAARRERALEIVAPVLSPAVAMLFAMCECGHDRGDHMVEAPHGCEGDASCTCGAYRTVEAPDAK